MNTGKRKLLRGLTSILIASAAIMALAGCENHKNLTPIKVQDEMMFSYEYKDAYGYALGVNHVFVVYGTYQGIHSGEAVNFTKKKVYSYSIKDLLDRYEILRTPKAIKAAESQGNISIL